MEMGNLITGTLLQEPLKMWAPVLHSLLLLRTCELLVEVTQNSRSQGVVCSYEPPRYGRRIFINDSVSHLRWPNCHLFFSFCCRDHEFPAFRIASINAAKRFPFRNSVTGKWMLVSTAHRNFTALYPPTMFSTEPATFSQPCCYITLSFTYRVTLECPTTFTSLMSSI